MRGTGSREEEIRETGEDANILFFFKHAIFCRAACQKGDRMTETGTTIAKERVEEL